MIKYWMRKTHNWKWLNHFKAQKVRHLLRESSPLYRISESQLFHPVFYVFVRDPLFYLMLWAMLTYACLEVAQVFWKLLNFCLFTNYSFLFANYKNGK